MISGNIYESSELALLPEPLRRAVNFLKENDLAHHEPGRFELDGENMILQVLDVTTKPREELRPECHRRYIDVQFLAAGGPEDLDWQRVTAESGGVRLLENGRFAAVSVLAGVLRGVLEGRAGLEIRLSRGSASTFLWA